MKETWRRVYGGVFAVSNYGRFKRMLNRTGTKKLNGIITPQTDRYGYPYVKVHIDGVSEHQTIHRLVALAFIGPCPMGNGGVLGREFGVTHTTVHEIMKGRNWKHL